MIYLIGVVLVLLLIALVFIFRPPKPESYEDSLLSETETDIPMAVDSQLEGGEDLDQAIDESAKTELTDWEDVTEIEELDLTFDEPSEGHHGEADEFIEELDLASEEEVGDESRQDVSDTEDRAAESEIDETVSDDLDDDIPFIDEGEEGVEQKKEIEVAPALADVPEDYAQKDTVEPPDELEARLDFFLGAKGEEHKPDADKSEPEVEEPEPEQVEETDLSVEDSVEVDDAEKAETAVEEIVESSHEGYWAQLQKQIEEFRQQMDIAIAEKNIGKLGQLEAALESFYIKQADLDNSFQKQQTLLEEMDDVLTEVQEVLPGFQLEACQKNLRDNEYDVVRSLLTEAASQLDQAPELASKILYHCGLLDEERGDLSGALDMYTKALESDESRQDIILAAGRLYRVTGDLDNAVLLLEKRVATGQEREEESVEQARAEHELARALISADSEKEKAEQLLAQALESIEKLLGKEHPDMGHVLHDLAVLYDSDGKYEQAEPLYQQALELIEKGQGSSSPRLGVTLNKLAGLYEEIEMEKKSESLYTKALEIRQKVLGENHPDIGSIMGHLANLLKVQGRYDQAEPMYRKSLEIAEAALGKDHPNLAVVLNDIAELYSEMGDEKQAEHFQERAFALFELPGMGDGFVEMEKDTGHDADDDKDQVVTGS